MTAEIPKNETAQEPKVSDKELNFRQLEAKYEKQLAQERTARLEMEKEIQRLAQEKVQKVDEDEEEDDEPYVDHKRLKKKLNKFGQTTQSAIQQASEKTKLEIKEELKKEMWLENNPDFYDILQHAEKLAQRAPRLAETILRMPDGFERQKLVYENIKEFGLHKPPEKQSTIQDKVDANRKSPYYQPSGANSPPYASVGDFSPVGQQQAFQKMQELKKRLGAF